MDKIIILLISLSFHNCANSATVTPCVTQFYLTTKKFLLGEKCVLTRNGSLMAYDR